MLGLSLGLAARRRAGKYDADDLSKGTLLLDFAATNAPTLDLNFVTDRYAAWADDPTWPYGVIGVFKAKG